MNRIQTVLARGVLTALLMAPAVAVMALPAEIEADRLVLAAQEKISQQDFEGARQYLERVMPLKVEPKPVFHYLYGQVLLNDGKLEQADAELAQYVNKVGREGEHYEAALGLLTQIEEQRRTQEAVGSTREQALDLKAAGIEASDTQGKAFDDRARRDFPAGSLAESLALAANSLLRSNMYIEGKIKNPATSNRESYSVSVKAPSELLVTKTSHNNAVNNGQAELSVEKLNAFGVNPFVSYRCSSAGDSCVLPDPVSGADWIRIANDEKAARELSTALTRLLKALQR
ncbi:MAG TPA: hypothetical protein VM553_17035 [Dongiaceae bacterium]|nr:hypothetical protein [Dongiaceae bacterium]